MEAATPADGAEAMPDGAPADASQQEASVDAPPTQDAASDGDADAADAPQEDADAAEQDASIADAEPDAYDSSYDAPPSEPPDAAYDAVGQPDATGFSYGIDGQSCGAGLTCAGKSCCDRIVIPAGTFLMGRSEAGPDSFSGGSPDEVPEHIGEVSEYALDRFEVTVGRFRSFVGSFDGTPPVQGVGAAPHAPDSGWQTAWNAFLPANGAALAAAIQCSPTGQTWTDAPGGNEDKPINCLNWYEAYAFCVWDGGRLPTEEEWEYAAAGGSENRLYPWGSASPSASLANTSCVDSSVCGAANILSVGGLPAGAGRWGHEDLGGNVWEWNLDWYKWDYYTLLPIEGCVDCVCLNPPVKAFRSARGGAFDMYPDQIRAAKRGRASDDKRYADVGLRCAR